MPSAAPNGVNLRMLEIFLRVAEEGTMSAAAERLGMSQAAVSQAITALEAALTIRLFDRSVRPPALTLPGKLALRYASEIGEKVQEFVEAMRKGGSGRVPLLRIGMLDSFTSTAGASMLEHLRDIATEWTVVSGFKATTIQALLDRRSDVIITSDDSPVPAEVDALPLMTEPFVLAVPESFHGNVVDMKILAAKLDFIRYGRDAHMGPLIDGYLKRAGLDLPSRYQFDTTDAALRMVAGGFGWTIVTPLIVLKSLVQPNTVRVLALPGKPVRRHLILAMRRGEGTATMDRFRSAAISTLKDIVLPRIAVSLPHFVGSVELASGRETRKRRLPARR